MAGYGMSKAATHFLVKALAAQFDDAAAATATTAGQGTVVAVLPTTLDTPANRAGMPGADFAGWTKVWINVRGSEGRDVDVCSLVLQSCGSAVRRRRRRRRAALRFDCLPSLLRFTD